MNHKSEIGAEKSLRVREAEPRDRAAWLRLRQELWPDCSDEKNALEMSQVTNSGGVVFVAEDERGNVIAFLDVSLRRDHVDGSTISPVPYLEGWYVRPEFRSRGIGRALIACAEQWAVSRGYTEFASDALIENELSIRLHKQLGFAEIDRNVTFLKKLALAP